MPISLKFLKNKIKRAVFGTESYGLHYSQSGEDVNLRAIMISFFNKRSGFYIDVGSFHPFIGSNTNMFYKAGWNGINIDPRPGSKALFDAARPRDINLEVGVGSKNETLKYYFIADNSAMNSFSKQTLIDNGVLDEVKKVFDCPVMPLQDIIDSHVPQNTTVDFLNIDAEGFEIEVLSSIDWIKNRPVVILIEQNNVCTFDDVLSSETCSYLKQKNYSPVAKNIITKTISTVIYSDNLAEGKKK